MLYEEKISAKKATHINWSVADENTPFVKKIIQKIADTTGKSYNDVLQEVKEKNKEFLDSLPDSDKFFKIQKMNSIESILFNKLGEIEDKIDDTPKLDEETFYYMFKAIVAKNKAFMKIRDWFTGKRLKFNVMLTPAPSFVKLPSWASSVETAAASPEGDVIFNKKFAQQLIDYAYLKGVKAKGSMYESNGGKVPDSYAYLEFLILHEIYHIVHADHFFQSTKKGMTPAMQNYLGDFITNYNLVKAGYPQLPIGLFSDYYNYDNFDTMNDMQDDIIEEFKKLSEQNKEDLDKLMDDHMDANHQKTNKNNQQNQQGQQNQQNQDSQQSQNQQGNQNQQSKDGQGNQSQDGQDNQNQQSQDNQQNQQSNQNQQSKDRQSQDGQGNQSQDRQDNQNQQSQQGQRSSQNQQSKDGQSQGGQPKVDPEDLDKAFKDADKDLPPADDNLSQEELDRRIKELEEQRKKENNLTAKQREELLAKERAEREKRLKQLKDMDENYQPINWKKLIKSMIPKPKETEEESMTKMHRRTIGQLALGNKITPVKAGITKGEEASQDLLFILDSSGSMSDIINNISQDLLRLIDKNKSYGIKNMYIIRFDTDWDVYRVFLDMHGKKHTYQPFKNRMDLLNDPEKAELVGKPKPIKQLFQMSWGAGTEFPPEIAKIIENFQKKKVNQVLFTDSDIIWEENLPMLQKACRIGRKKPYSFNVILASKRDFIEVSKSLGAKYKYMSYLSEQ